MKNLKLYKIIEDNLFQLESQRKQLFFLILEPHISENSLLIREYLFWTDVDL
jgi:hypothetical protein